MPEALRPARLDWSQGLPISADSGVPYFSRDGDAASQHVFLQGNDLPARFSALSDHDNFTIIETGFGTGLNWLSTQALRAETGHRGWLHYVSVEKHPLTLTDLEKAQAFWPSYAVYAAALQQAWPALVPGFHRLVFPEWRSTLTLVFADEHEALPRLAAQADAWFLDGFSSKPDPAMWNTALFRKMALLSHTGSSLAALTASDEVRHELEAAGFAVEKIPGFGNNSEMLRGHCRQPARDTCSKPWLARPALAASLAAPRRAVVIGAGIAGASTAQALAQRGWQITVLEKNRVAGAASGNPAAIIGLTPAPTGQALDHFPQQAGLHTLRLLRQAPDCWHPCGIIELPAPGRRKTKTETAAQHDFPAELWSSQDADKASAFSGLSLKRPASWQAQSGWMDAAAWCRDLLVHPAITLKEQQQAAKLEQQNGEWVIRSAEGEVLAQAAVVILASSHEARQLQQATTLPLRVVRGQIASIPATVRSAALQSVICERGYISPALPSGEHCAGASFVPDDTDISVREEEFEALREELVEAVPALEAALAPVTQWRGRASLRCQSPDYLPLLGPLADPEKMRSDYDGLRQGKVQDYPALTPLPGLYANLAHGSKGFSQALLAAEILAAEINGEPAPVSQACLEALHPMRFLIRDLKRGA